MLALRCKGVQTTAAAFLTTRNARLISKNQYRFEDDAPAILTLDRTKLQSKAQKIHDISLKKILIVKFRTSGGPTAAQFRFQATKDEDRMTQDMPFPPNTRGVFYYHIDPKLPPVSGAIMFRLCDSLKTFDKGEDLDITIRKPWRISLLRIAHNHGFNGLARFLVEERLVQKDLLQDLRKLDPPTKFVGLYLYDLSQPLVIDLQATAFILHLVTRKSYSSTIVSSPFYNTNKAQKPYSGLAKVRFELSTLREHGKLGPTLVLRILEFLSPAERVLPLDSGPYIELVPNTLVMRRTVGGHFKPWAYPIFNRSKGAKWREFLAASSS